MQFLEASSHDQIKMTEFWLDFDRKIFTPTNLNVGALPKFTAPTSIKFTPKKYAGAVCLDRSPSPGLQARTGWDTCPASLAPLLCSSTRKHQAWWLEGPRM